jgi:hypothetical protein
MRSNRYRLPIPFCASRPLLAIGWGGLLTLVPLGNAVADDPGAVNAAPTDASTSGAADAGNPAVSPDAAPPDDSQNTSRAQVPDVTQNPANPQPTNIPLFPAQLGNPISPYSSSSANPQSPEITAPSLFLTGNRDLSQVSTNNALSQAFGQQGVESGFYGDTGVSYENAPIERIRLGPFDLKAALVAGVVADDNVRSGGGTETGKKGDVSYGVTPAILLVYGLHDGQKGYASLVYSPTLTRFYHESGQNSDDQNVAFNAIYPLQRLTFNLTQTYTETSGVNQDSNVRTTQNSSLSTIGATYEVDDKISLSSQVQEVVNTFSGENGGGGGSNSGGQGENTTSINNNLNYRLSDKLTVGPNLNVGFDRPQNSDKSTFEQGLISLNYAPTEKIGLYAQGGAEFIQYDQGGGNKVNPIFSLGVGYNPFDSTNFSLSASQSEHSSTAEIGEPTGGDTVVSTSVSATVTQRVVQRIFLSFAFSYEHDDDQALSGSAGTVDGGATGSSSEDTITYRPSLSFAPTEWSSLALYYQYLTNQSNTPGQSYNDNQVGLSVSVQF